MAVSSSTGADSHLSFGAFEVDFDQWQLRKSGTRVKLQRKPFQILRLLLQRRGELVTRAEIAKLLWPDLHVDFERSLNTAVNSLREALGDTPRSCRYIETCPGLGYRFIGAVEVLERVNPAKAHAPAAPIVSLAETDFNRGQFFYDKVTPENLARARSYFEASVHSDPDYAPAHAGLANVEALLGAWSVIASPAAGEQALLHAQRALNTDPRSADARVALANAHWLLRKPWAAVEAEYRRALAIDRNCFSAHLWYAVLLAASARHAEAAEHFEVAQRIRPLSLLLHYQMAWGSYCRRAYRDAVQHAWDALTLDSAFAPAQYILGLAYEQLGMADDAITEFENARRSSNDHPATLASLAHALSKRGLECSAVLAQLENTSRTQYCSPFWVAVAAVGRNDQHAALTAIADAARAGDWLTDWLGVEPRFDPLRLSPQFQNWLRLL